MRIAHVSDWHLSAQGSRIDPESGLNARLMDFYRCARFSVEEGVRQGAELILHAGDAFDGSKPTPTDLFLFREAVAPALNAGVPMFLLLGNHDMPRNQAERHALDPLRGLPGLTIVDCPEVLGFWGGPQVKAISAKTEYDSEPELQIACLPWPNKQLFLADEEAKGLAPEQLTQLVAEKMLDVARWLASQLIPNVPSVLLAHLSVDLAQAGGQNRLMAYGGEWTISLHDLQGLGFDAVMLGHIHKPQIWADMTLTPPVAYSGSPEACSFGEEGEEKSFLLWDISRIEGMSPYPGWQTITTPYRRHVTIEVDAVDGYLEAKSSEVKDAIVRLRLPEARAAEARSLIQSLEELGAYEVRLEIERAETQRRREAVVESAMSKEQALAAWLDQRPEVGEIKEAVIAEHRKLSEGLAAGG